MTILSGSGVRRTILISSLFLVAAVAAGTELAHAQTSTASGASPWVETAQTQVRLVAATTAVGDTETIRLGLQFKLIPDWKVYWRNPGAAGFPPAIDWTGSSNLDGADFLWPAPRRFSVLGLDTLGYKDEVVFPIDVRVERANVPLVVAAEVTYLTCNEVCVPYTADLALTLPSGHGFATPFSGLIEGFAARVPGADGTAGLTIGEAAAVGVAGDQVLRVAARSESPFAAPDLYVEATELFEFSAPVAAFTDDRRQATFEIMLTTIGSDIPDLAGRTVTLTLIDGPRAIEVPIAALPGIVASSSLRVLLGVLALALLGGLILNLMPCVLPVLSLKLLSVVQHGGASARQIRAGFLATAAGILCSFLVIAAGLIAVKSAGLAVGWGIQFQQPLFLVSMTLLLTLFAANLWGVFEIPLPGGLADRVGRPDATPTLRGHFLTGAFATLLATPCSAPFLGSAVGFALSRGAPEIIAIFLALGVGLAVPYLVVAAFPAVAGRLPRPGQWMKVLRAILGVALAGTGIWLLTVLATQAGAGAALAVGGAMFAIVGLLLIGRKMTAPGGAATWAVAAVVAVMALAAPATLGGRPADREIALADRAIWSRFDADEITGLVRAGKVVFVDVTADWCLTCQINKKLVLDRDPVATELGRDGIVAMLADWTRPDPAIAAYLARFGRYGIPFNAVYGPGAPRGLPLPELLTDNAVMTAIQRARAGS